MFSEPLPPPTHVTVSKIQSKFYSKEKSILHSATIKCCCLMAKPALFTSMCFIRQLGAIFLESRRRTFEFLRWEGRREESSKSPFLLLSPKGGPQTHMTISRHSVGRSNRFAVSRRIVSYITLSRSINHTLCVFCFRLQFA